MTQSEGSIKGEMCDHIFLCKKWLQDVPPKAREYRMRNWPWIKCPRCRTWSRLPVIDAGKGTNMETLAVLDRYFKGFRLMGDTNSDTSSNPMHSSYLSPVSLPMDTVRSMGSEESVDMSDLQTAEEGPASSDIDLSEVPELQFDGDTSYHPHAYASSPVDTPPMPEFMPELVLSNISYPATIQPDPAVPEAEVPPAQQEPQLSRGIGFGCSVM